MKRRDLVRHLALHGCAFLREGGGHSIFRNAATGQQSSIPRHREVGEKLARKICKDLGVPAP
ncbi:MAG: type II toxin-antitoxin system HicA family toxin [Planctomycetota bacterium]|nr:type II toxin-antitoxin system HicA family toxin [Planctomycetota bacterium]